MMRAQLLAVAGSLALAACAGGADGQPSADGGNSCGVTLTFNPSAPIADPISTIRVSSSVYNAPGVLAYTWTLQRGGNDVPFTYQAADHSQIDFVAPVAGVYDVGLAVDGFGCASTLVHLDVQAPGAQLSTYRLHVTPPASLAPPQESVFEVHGGADYDKSMTLDPGVTAAGHVLSGGAGVAAYLKFMPAAAPTAYVEAFTPPDGTFSVRLLGQAHDVLVVPASGTLAPRLVAWNVGMTILDVDAGTAVSGVVRDPANVALAGAKVQVFVNGIPSTLATTAADGSFTVRAVPVVGAQVEVDVMPPAGRGLPRLHSSAAALDLAQSVQVRYGATITTCDLANTLVKRGAVNLANAKVTVVGTLSSIGTVTAGAAATAAGSVRIGASASATARLPSVLVPRGQLSAVVEAVPGDLAVVALDTTACPAFTLDAPAAVYANGNTQDALGNALPNVRVEAIPIGALALAAALPTQVTSGIGGAFSLALASGGHYDLHVVDPAGRGAPFVSTNLVGPINLSPATLPPALHVSGQITVSGNANPLLGTSVQILCVGCTGLDAARPLAETATDDTSHYRIAVPDPGTL
jgi:hypothetical protein